MSTALNLDKTFYHSCNFFASLSFSPNKNFLKRHTQFLKVNTKKCLQYLPLGNENIGLGGGQRG